MYENAFDKSPVKLFLSKDVWPPKLLQYCYNFQFLGWDCSSFHFSNDGIGEEAVRAAILAFVDKHCCYGSRPAKNMNITRTIPTHAYHVSSTCTMEHKLSPVHTSCECECKANIDVTNSYRILRNSWAVLNSLQFAQLKQNSQRALETHIRSIARAMLYNNKKKTRNTQRNYL